MMQTKELRWLRMISQPSRYEQCIFHVQTAKSKRNSFNLYKQSQSARRSSASLGS